MDKYMYHNSLSTKLESVMHTNLYTLSVTSSLSVFESLVCLVSSVSEATENPFYFVIGCRWYSG